MKFTGFSTFFNYIFSGAELLLAYWPDALHLQKIETFTHWHYIDIPFSNNGTQAKVKMDTDNVAWAIEQIIPIVQNEQANVFERSRFLAFLIHLIGDIHQPLHTVTYVSENFPQGDQGGNLFFVRRDHARIRLHRYWDDGLGLLENEPNMENMTLLTNKIMHDYPKTYFGALTDDLGLDDWLKEGLSHAQNTIYTIEQDQIASAEYIVAGRKLSERQLALAGYRLAAVLNQLLVSR